jgi:hypothetical protein
MMDPANIDILLTFRHLADDARTGLQQVRQTKGEVRVVAGYLEAGDVLESYRPLSIPVRRTYRESDRAAFVRVCQILTSTGVADLIDRVAEVKSRYDQVMKDLSSYTILNDKPLEHRLVFDAWLDAVIFGGFGGKDKKYRVLVEECGKAVEGVAVRITEGIAERMLELAPLVSETLQQYLGQGDGGTASDS